jgi:hypothetical protein
MRRTVAVTVAVCCAAFVFARSPQPAHAFNPIGTACNVAGWFSGLAGKACNAGNTLLGLGKKLFGGHSASNTTSKVQAAVGLAAIGAWVMGGAKVAMEETAKVLGHTTSPRLTTTWFSSTYWRMAGLAAVLTLPFLFAAAIQALTRSDLTLLMRAAFGYLPLAMLAVGIAAPVTMLLLAATDQMCSVVSAAGGNAGARFLSHVGAAAGLVSILDGSAFLAFLIGLFAAFGALVLWLELLLREAAVYVIVLMLPLAFAALVWPARRVWATRAVEMLVALILSKFAIVAVLTLGASALGHSTFVGPTSMMVGLVLVILGAFAPWAVLRLVPLAEMASGAAAALHGESWRLQRAVGLADSGARLAIGAGAGGTQREALDEDDIDDAEPGSDRAARAETERLGELARVSMPVGARTNGDTPSADARANGGMPRTDGGADGTEKRGEDEAEVDPERPDERIPGLNPLFQMEDNSWRPIVLGLDEDGQLPPPPGPLEDGPPDPGPADIRDSRPPPDPSHQTDPLRQTDPMREAGGREAQPDAAPADDQDPLPPTQEPEDGLL